MTRERKLDALFAERVIGCAVVWLRPVLPGEPDACCGCGAGKHGEYPMMNLPPYTRSLDAAWEGLQKTGSYLPGYWKLFARENVSTPQVEEMALRLVLYLLRKVGVTKEEIEACGVDDAS